MKFKTWTTTWIQVFYIFISIENTIKLQSHKLRFKSFKLTGVSADKIICHLFARNAQ